MPRGRTRPPASELALYACLRGRVGPRSTVTPRLYVTGYMLRPTAASRRYGVNSAHEL